MEILVKLSTLILIATALFSNLSIASDTGDVLFEKLCMSCHAIKGKPKVAPPIFGVINHVKGAYPNREEFVQRVVGWVKEPSADKSLMPGAIKKFGVMPKLGFADSDVRLIAEYLYEEKIELSDWYIEHYKQEHGAEPPQ